MNPQRGQRQTACMRYISAPHRSHSILSWPGAATFTSFTLTEAEAGGRAGGSDIRADYVMTSSSSRAAFARRTFSDAMRRVPRDAFARRDLVRFAYDDRALAIGEGQNHRRRRQRRLRARCPVVTALSSAPAHRVCPDRSGINLPMAAVSSFPSERSITKELMVIRATQSIRRVATRDPSYGSCATRLVPANAETQRRYGLAHVLFIDGDRNCVLTCCAISLHFVGYESQTEKARARDRR